MKRSLFFLALICCFGVESFAQQQPTTNFSNKPSVFKTTTKNTSSYFAMDQSDRKNAIAVSFGSPGIGFEFARKLGSKLTARVAYHTFNLKDYEVKDVSIGSEKVSILGNLETQAWDFGAEYTPFTNSSFKLTFGLGILSNVNLNAKVNYQEDITYGDVTVAAANVGHILIDSKWSGTAPFLGIGFGRAVPKNRIGLSFELGTYFASSPEVNLDATKLLGPTKDQEADLQDAFETLKFIPRAQIKLAIKL
ncbi:hypothetical protein [Polaribacter pacificus]|nr:hypothetical protein [Polaribacter pacificus]